MYESLKESIQSMVDGTQIRPVGTDGIERLMDQFPGIPEEYLIFLSEIGWGDVGIYVYEKPMQPYEIYPEDIKELETIILFGDDCQGYCFGFDVKNNYELIEVEPPGQIRVLNRSFKEHIFKWLGDPVDEASDE